MTKITIDDTLKDKEFITIINTLHYQVLQLSKALRNE